MSAEPIIYGLIFIGVLVLVEGLQRLEACRSLGEETIVGLLVQARKH